MIYYVSDVIKGVYDLGALGRICMVEFGKSLERSTTFHSDRANRP